MQSERRNGQATTLKSAAGVGVGGSGSIEKICMNEDNVSPLAAGTFFLGLSHPHTASQTHGL